MNHSQDPSHSNPENELDPSGSSFWHWMRQTARLWGFLLFFIFVCVLFRSVLLPFVLAFLATFILAPIVRFFERHSLASLRLPRWGYVICIYVVLLGFIGLFFVSFVPRVSRDLMRVLQEAPKTWERINTQLVPELATWIETNFLVDPGTGDAKEHKFQTKTPSSLKIQPLPNGQFEVDLSTMRLEIERKGEESWVIRSARPGIHFDKKTRITDTLQRYLAETLESTQDNVDHVVAVGQKFLAGLFSTLTTLLLVFMISAFLLIDTEKIFGGFRSLIPLSFHSDFDKVVVQLDRALSGAIRGQLLICVVNGILTGIGLLLIDVKYPFLLALLAGVMSLIPIFGSIISTIPIVIVALVSGEGLQWSKGIMIGLWIAGIHLIEANYLNPKIIGTAARIHPVIVIFSVVAGERTYGAIGALLAVPIVSVVQTLFIYVRAKVRGEDIEATFGGSSGSA